MKRLLGLYRGMLLAGIWTVILAVSPPVFADEPTTPKIYIVEVLGEPLVAERLRAAVARELSVTAVAPDDPRAATATARLRFDARAPQKSLRVTFSRAEVPVTRVVTLPDDAARAETVAVFLAGNLARDEARDLLEGLVKPGTPKPSASEAPASAKDAGADDLERMRRMLRDDADRGRRGRVGVTHGRYVVSAALLVPGILSYRSGLEDGVAARRDVGLGVIGAATALSFVATLELLSTSDEEALYAELKSIEADGQEPSAIIHRTERAWEKRAESAKGSRRQMGFFDLGLSLATLTFGTMYALPGTAAGSDPTRSAVLLSVGVAEALAGFYTLFTESSIERSYAAWQVLRQDHPPASASLAFRPRLGVAPTPGGAYFSGGFVF